jgi:SAM-dependent methyltransferase
MTMKLLDFVLMAQSFEPGFASVDRWRDMIFIRWPIALAPLLFTWLLPLVLSFRQGGMARWGLAISLALSLLLPIGLIYEPWNALYWRLHPWLYGIFYLYALAGIGLCAVGIYDGKRSAIWGLFAVLSLTLAAVADTLIWLNIFRSPPWIPWGFIGFGVLMAVAWIRRPADPRANRDVRESAAELANNLTRRSRSIPRKLLREGELHMLPVYYLLNLSDLAKEGIARSGSFEFADHIYRNQPSGTGALGRWIDAQMLASPASVAFRNRYERARDEMHRVLESRPVGEQPLRVLAIPCGLPRDLVELAESLARDNPQLLARIEYHGMDIDPELLARAREFTAACPVRSKEFHQGNALLSETFPPGPFQFVVSTGLVEFLERDQLERFFQNVHDVLAPGGTFFTSATRRERSSETLMRAFELITHYRTPDELEEIFSEIRWSKLKLVPHETGLQTFAVAVR